MVGFHVRTTRSVPTATMPTGAASTSARNSAPRASRSSTTWASFPETMRRIVNSSAALGNDGCGLPFSARLTVASSFSGSQGLISTCSTPQSRARSSASRSR